MEHNNRNHKKNNSPDKTHIKLTIHCSGSKFGEGDVIDHQEFCSSRVNCVKSGALYRISGENFLEILKDQKVSKRSISKASKLQS